MSTPWSRSRGRITVIICAMIFCSFFSISESMAAIPKKISYQGVLTDSNGTPLSDGQYQMRFKIYDAATNGNLLWTEEWTGDSKVTVNGGLFNVLLGSIEPIDLGTLTFNAPYWLGVEVYNTGSSSYETLSPRHELASAAYALRAAKVEDGAISASALASSSVTGDKISAGAITDAKVDSLSASKITSGTINNDRINWAAPGSIGTTTAGTGYFTDLFASGNVGIGATSSPATALEIVGDDWSESRINIKNTTEGQDPVIALYAGNDYWAIHHDDSENNELNVRYNNSTKISVQTNGNVGIGTMSPLSKLHIMGSSDGSSYGEMMLSDGNSGGVNDRRLVLRSPRTGEGYARIFLQSTGSSLRIGTRDYSDLVDLDNSSGNVGIGKTDPGYKLDVAGTIRGENYSCPNGDIAEKLPIHPDYALSSKELKNKVSKLDLPDTEKKAMIERKEISKLEPGTVVVISKGGVVPCAKKNDTHLAGIISTSPAVKMASEEKGQYIALAGKVPCKVTGKIKAGDMLTTSTIEGHAQKAEQPVLGAVVGKALEDCDGERGVIEVWVGGM